MSEPQLTRPRSYAVALVGALTLFRLWAASRAELVPDETYYWLWSRGPAAGYYDHPPMIAWWIWLSIHIVGDTPLGVRLFSLLSAAGTSLAVFGTARELGLSEHLAGRAAIWLNAMLLIGVGAILSTPDAPSILFWALTVWCLAALRRTEKSWLWLVAGFLAGLGGISKYTNLFLGIGILLWLLLEPGAQKWLRSPWLWLGGFVALATMSPTLLWNEQHGWVSFHKQFGRIGEGHLTGRYIGEFLLGQIGLLNPAVALFAGLAIRKVAEGWEWQRNPAAFLGALSLPLAAYMLLHSFHDRVQGNWPAPIYPAVALLAAIGADAMPPNPLLQRLGRWLAPAGIGLSVLALGLTALPEGPALPYATPADQLAGWRQIAAAIEASRTANGASWIGTADYGLTGELAFNGLGFRRVQEVVDRNRYSFMPRTQITGTGLLVLRGRDGPFSRYANCLGNAEPTGVLRRKAGTRIIEEYRLFKLGHYPANLLQAGCSRVAPNAN